MPRLAWKGDIGDLRSQEWHGQETGHSERAARILPVHTVHCVHRVHWVHAVYIGSCYHLRSGMRRPIRPLSFTRGYLLG